MPRIRTYKPKFLRHELLQELEVKHYKLKPMLVFLGLWSLSDKAGRFEWKPKTMKLDILPFIKFDIEESMMLLVEHEFVTKYEVAGKHYGQVDTFTIHQRISGKEAQESSHLPSPVLHGEAVEKQLRKQEGNGVQEQEQEGNSETLSKTPFLERQDLEVLVEPPKNSDQIIENILRLHPFNWHWKHAGNGKLELPHSQLTAVIEAIGRHQWTAVLEGTKVYGEFINLNPGFVLKPERFYGPEIHYLKTKQDWEKSNGTNHKRSEGALGKSDRNKYAKGASLVVTDED